MKHKTELRNGETVLSRAKKAVVRSAMQAVREDSPRAVTLRNIARRAQLTEPAIFRHFEGIKGLFADLFSQVDTAWQNFAGAFDPGLSGLQRLEQALRFRVQVYAADIDLSYLALYAAQTFGEYVELRSRIDEFGKRDVALVDACLKDALAKKQLCANVSVAAFRAFSLGATTHVVQQWIREKGAFDLVKAFDALWDDFFKLAALKAAPRAVKKPLAPKDPPAKKEPRASAAKAVKAAKPAAKTQEKAVKSVKSATAAKVAKAAPKAAGKPRKAAILSGVGRVLKGQVRS